MKLVNQLLERLRPRPSTRPADAAPAHKASIAKTIHDALASAGLDGRTSQGSEISRIINDSLARAGLLDGRAAPAATPGAREEVAGSASPPLAQRMAQRIEHRGDPRGDTRGDHNAGSQGQFLSRSFASPAGTLAYKVYVPARYEADAARAAPLLVMLHGCTQSPDDFAAGTRMNALADQHGFLVAYPAQSANANGSKCWNWFRQQDQARGSGEPALIAGMTAQVAAAYQVDPTRVYVAGLSAGAAMAVVLGATYPDVFAAVGAHSGLPYRAAHDMGSAFAAMKGAAARSAHATPPAAGQLMPTIVFHGDRDHTVAAANGDAIVAQATGARVGELHASAQERGTADGGRGFLRTTYADASGTSVVEDWRVQGGGHAWMGGSAAGSYTDPQGPDASAEMVRFFLQHARPAVAHPAA
ncbi:MAG: PHB depolymerase family esterase [Thermomonas sp.]